MWDVTTTFDWGRRPEGQSLAQRHATPGRRAARIWPRAEKAAEWWRPSRPPKFAVHIVSVSADSLVSTAHTEFSRRDIGLKLRVKPGVLDRAVSDKVALRMRIVAHPHSQDAAGSSDRANPG